MSETKQAVLTVLIAIAIIVLFFGGLIWSLVWQNNSWTQAAKDQCAVIAQVADTKEYKVDGDYNCNLVKDGKLVQVKDW